MSTRVLEFVSVLGKGGFGSVYLANLRGPSGFRRRVAVKVMNAGFDGNDELAGRQRDEARLLGLLGHEGIVQVLDLTVVGGRPAVVMEYVEGVDLSRLQRARADRRLPPRAALEAIAAAADALDAAFRAVDPDSGRALNVIHRDIKPANLLVTVGGTLKVLDFGVARADFSREGHTGGAAFGTPRFMAPEQWLGEPYDASVDVYALGVTLHELLSGRPWERPALAEHAFAEQVDRALAAGGACPGHAALVRAMTAFLAQDRPSAAEAGARARALASTAEGATLAEVARAEVPSLVAAQRAAAPAEPLPPSTSLGGLAPAGAAEVTAGHRVPAADSDSPPATLDPAEPRPRPTLLLAAGIAATGIAAAGLGAASFLVLREPPPLPYTAQPEAGTGPPAPRTSGAPSSPAVPGGERAAASLPDVGAAAPSPPEAPRIGDPSSPDQVAQRGSGGNAPAVPPKAAPPPTPVAEPASATTPEPSPETAPVANGTPAAHASAAAFRLSISTEPIGATVAVDGRPIGRSPVSTDGLVGGEHRIEVELDGRSASRTVTVGEGLPAGLRYTFDTQTWRTVR